MTDSANATGGSVSALSPAQLNEEQYGPIADKYATQYGIPTTIYRSLINTESSWNPYALNGDSGAYGLAQLMPNTAMGLGLNEYDTNENLQGGAAVLAQFYKKFSNWRDAISAYKGYGNHLSDGYDKAGAVLTGAGYTADGSNAPAGPGAGTSTATTGDPPGYSTSPTVTSTGGTTAVVNPAIANWLTSFGIKSLLIVGGVIVIIACLILAVSRTQTAQQAARAAARAAA